MMRPFLALLLSLLVATVAPAAPRDWALVARPAAAGGYLVGNPAAKVKLVEYVSYTCPHCRHFEEQSAATLGAMIRSGSTSVEVRSQIHDKIDLVAVTLARCLGAANFPKYHRAVFARQDEWFGKAAAYDQSGAAAQLPTQQARARAFADQSGLSAIARDAGMTAAQLDGCFATQANLDAAIKATSTLRSDVTGTPTFEINGKLVQRVGWAELEPMLRAAGAK